MGLFRKEVLGEKRNLHGKVLLVQPVSFFIISVFVASLVTGGVFLLFWGSYARTESVLGYLAPTKGFIKVFPHRGGVVSETYVKQGQYVSTGDNLAFLKVALAMSGGNTPEAVSYALVTKQRKYLTDQLDFEKDALALNIRKMQSERHARKREFKALMGQLEAQTTITKLSESSFKDAQSLQKTGSISRSKMELRQREYLGNLRQKQVLKQEIASLHSKIEQLGYQLAQAPITSAQHVAELQGQIAGLAQRQTELEGREGYLLKAPIPGTVTALNLHVGRAVDARVPLLAIIPEGSELEAELFVPSRAIGFVDVGQEVRLLFDAFPYQRFGSFPAKIETVSGAVMSPEESGSPFTLNEPTYRISAKLKTQYLLIADTKIVLQTGMKLTGNIILERRSFIDWLLDPIRAVRRRSE